MCVGHRAEHGGPRCSKSPGGQQSNVLLLRGLHTQLRLVSRSSEGSSIGYPSALKANRFIGGSEFRSDWEFRLQTPPLPPSLVSVRWPSVVASPVPPLGLNSRRQAKPSLLSTLPNPGPSSPHRLHPGHRVGVGTSWPLLLTGLGPHRRPSNKVASEALSVIPATQEAEVRGTHFQEHLGLYRAS